ncbi:MAG TPA: hypothetical protein VFJ90_02915, partial [Candidatus Didemnitutus sp.]|nr:hypothetical protein [Candidatus Didemnitutus sp.]
MLKAVFFWLDSHPASYWWFALAGTVPLAMRLVAAVRDTSAPRATDRSDVWLDALALMLFLLAWRWPFLLVAHEFNMDESQFIGGTLGLARDPVFWRGTDGNTSGPLDYYTLLPVPWLGLPLDYFTARLTGLLVIWSALTLCLRLLAGLFNRTSAWLGVLPAAVFFATTSDPDFLHYSSETTSIGLIALAAWLLVRTHRTGSYAALLAASAVAGSLPWAKLQAAPIGAGLVLIALWLVWLDRARPSAVRWRRAGVVTGAALAPTLVVLGLAVATTGIDIVIRRYVAQNIFYAQGGRPFADVAGYFLRYALDQEANRMARFPMQDGRLFWLLVATVAATIPAMIRCLLRRERPHLLFVTGGLLTVAALAAILGPRRVSVHYLLFAIIPVTLWIGASVGVLWTQLRERRLQWGFAAGMLLLGGLLPLATRGLQPEPFLFGQMSEHWRHPRTGEAEIVRRLAGPDGSIGAWGWASYLYAETGLPPATRDALNQWSIDETVQRSHYRSVYLADLKASRPAVFVDTIGPAGFYYNDRAKLGHESYPELGDFIRQNYVLVVDWDRIRIYARNGREAGVDQAMLDAARRLRGPFHTLWAGSPPPLGSLGESPVDFYYRRPALMLFPPARLEWPLDETVRGIDLEYCFRPTAYDPGRTNGAEYIVELVGPHNTREVFHRQLRPVSVPADRGLQSDAIALPPFEPGAKLVLRTTSGEYNDQGWDWVYLSHLRFARSHTYVIDQFPGCNRTPDVARGDSITYRTEGGKKLMIVQGPLELTFVLHGGERTVAFGCGFELSAYTNGGQTDGVTYRVKLQRTGEEDRVL